MHRLASIVACVVLFVVAIHASCDPVFQTRTLFIESNKPGANVTAIWSRFSAVNISFHISDATGKLPANYAGPTTGVSALFALYNAWQTLVNQTISEVEFYGAPGSPRCLIYASSTFNNNNFHTSEMYLQVFTYDLRSCLLTSIVELDDTLLLYQVINAGARRN